MLIVRVSRLLCFERLFNPAHKPLYSVDVVKTFISRKSGCVSQTVIHVRRLADIIAFCSCDRISYGNYSISRNVQLPFVPIFKCGVKFELAKILTGSKSFISLFRGQGDGKK